VIRRSRRFRGVLILMGSVALFLGGLGQTARAQSRQETLIIARNIDDYTTNDPGRQYEFTGQMTNQSVYDTLVTVDAPDFTRIQPKLATKWDVSKDGTVYTFTLRPGVKFASGNPLTASDVKFSFRRLKNLKDNPAFFLDAVKEIDVVDDRTLKVTLVGPDASFLAALAAPQCGVLDAKTVTAQGGTDADDAKEKDKATQWLNENSAGSGPYRLVAARKGEEIVLDRNPAYWGAKPHFARIVFRHVKDGTTQREMVERGDADIAQGLDADMVAALKPGPRLALVEGLTMNFIYLALTNKSDLSKPLSDKRVREAIAYAIDYDGIVKGLARGGAVQPPANIPIGLLGVDPKMARKRDVARAKKLLADAGYANGFPLKMSYPTRPMHGIATEAMAAKIQADLKAIGVDLTLEPKEFSVAVGEYREGKTHLVLVEWGPDFLDPDGWADAFFRQGGPVAKRIAYENARATELVATAKKETDGKKRAELYREIQKIALEDAPYVTLIQPKTYAGLNPAIKGYAIHPIWFVTLARLSR
jgi:peptide/nickel transport system substrate-binding protein